MPPQTAVTTTELEDDVDDSFAQVVSKPRCVSAWALEELLY